MDTVESMRMQAMNAAGRADGAFEEGSAVADEANDAPRSSRSTPLPTTGTATLQDSCAPSRNRRSAHRQPGVAMGDAQSLNV